MSFPHKDLVSLHDYSRKDIEMIFERTKELKEKQKKGIEHKLLLKDKTLAMLFAKPSTRTRVSFETGMTQLEGHALYLGMNDMQLGRGETISDTAKVLSRYVDIIMARLFAHQDIVELAKGASVPVINGLTDLLHPCQALADIYTVYEHKGKLDGLKLTFVGDGDNNVTHSLMQICPKFGMDITVGCPKEYAPNPGIIENAKKSAAESGSKFTLVESPQEAVKGVDIVVTDTWVSMGRKDAEERTRTFKPYQVNKTLLKQAKPDAIVMHCLPAHRGYEITDEVMDGPQSVVFDEAENRLHTQKALMVLLLDKTPEPRLMFA